jgi:alpha-glucosidase (family GH31 glycosyl hydrolase)
VSKILNALMSRPVDCPQMLSFQPTRCSFTFGEENFPDPKKYLAQIKKEFNVKICVWIKASEWYSSKLDKLLELGVDSLKTDFGERIPHLGVKFFDGSTGRWLLW